MRVRHQFIHDHVHVFHISWAEIIPPSFILDKHCKKGQFRKLVVLVYVSICLAGVPICVWNSPM